MFWLHLLQNVLLYSCLLSTKLLLKQCLLFDHFIIVGSNFIVCFTRFFFFFCIFDSEECEWRMCFTMMCWFVWMLTNYRPESSLDSSTLADVSGRKRTSTRYTENVIFDFLRAFLNTGGKPEIYKFPSIISFIVTYWVIQAKHVNRFTNVP